MRTKIVFSIMVLFFVMQAPLIHAQANVTSEQIEQLLQEDDNVNGAIASISIRSSKNGEMLYSKQGNTRLRPASNLKLFTAASALSVLGEDYTFDTEIKTDGNIKRNILHGNLYIVGKGDPTLTQEKINSLMKSLKQKGIQKIKGDVIGDDTWYDDTRYSADLPWSDETAYYGSAISALTVSPDEDFDAGSIIMKVKPAKKIGKLAQINLEPKTEFVEIINETMTVSKEEKTDITFDRKHGTNQIVIKGEISEEETEQKETVALWEPTDYTLALVEQALHKNGIKLDGNIKRGVTPEKAKHLITHESIPLSELLVPFMKLSNNGHAETLVKEMGKVIKEEGSWEKGLEVMSEELTSFGLNPETMLIRDGSGVSHVNLVSANQITQLLYSVQDKEWFPIFLNSLPVAGGDNRIDRGTLYYRLSHTPVAKKVRAKTGTLTSVSTLAGYVETNSGDTLIFSIMLNNVLDGKKAKQLEDQIVLQLASS
ncbi:D-alanyl-D-alanine carboxypeptidase/D-alanyl-D-alanine-endopeptidase [Alkalihalobacillus sp. MEB130]|uniref:D-alanyl-D-alanine carboxypeptidase/D-alanyl-D-alanine endopeptidase n=1 Tax=Alkalihalobacillus sp. MEB130 TaxID=2976704 RepID=UPI0028DF4A13|nr:D-alanyl-D-alanine carboxypeptidase/D-alanyl-D-alanine-endopeptidase [Alkalihalobacillus sp. MEB130]MDT8861119.1 D-alanyl-D-alanine carboxypeptidase/D-alanyl-D-alanine-endopeptidase [Alkalihalobacillus sp. MEB130]